MRKLTIVCDVDDVLFNLLPYWVDIINKRHGTSVNAADITQWDMQETFPSLTKEQIRAPLLEREFWEHIPTINGACECLERLVEDGHKVYLCTATDHRNFKYKVEALQEHFPMIPKKSIMSVWDKSLIACDVFIDDAIFNLQGKYVSYKILVDQSYNQVGFKTNKRTRFRVCNWQEIYRIICDIASEDDKQR